MSVGTSKDSALNKTPSTAAATSPGLHTTPGVNAEDDNSPDLHRYVTANNSPEE